MSYFVYQKHLLERVRISFGRIVVMILAALKRIIEQPRLAIQVID